MEIFLQMQKFGEYQLKNCIIFVLLLLFHILFLITNNNLAIYMNEKREVVSWRKELKSEWNAFIIKKGDQGKLCDKYIHLFLSRFFICKYLAQHDTNTNPKLFQYCQRCRAITYF